MEKLTPRYETPGEMLGRLTRDGWPENVLETLEWLSDGPDEWHPITVHTEPYPFGSENQRYTIILATLQKIWIVVDAERKPIERGYVDRGDIHFMDVKAVIDRWRKSLQMGGPSPGSIGNYNYSDLYKEYSYRQRTEGLSKAAYAREKGMSRTTLYKIIKYGEDK